MNIKERILEKFGGTVVVARVCSVTPGAVSQWTVIPARHQPTLLAAAPKLGFELTPEDFFELPKIKKNRRSHNGNGVVSQ